MLQNVTVNFSVHHFTSHSAPHCDVVRKLHVKLKGNVSVTSPYTAPSCPNRKTGAVQRTQIT